MPDIRRDWPAVARLYRRQARFSRRKRPSGRCATPRTSENGVCGRLGGAFGHAAPLRAVAREGMDWLGEGCRGCSGRQSSEHGLKGLGLMTVPPETQVLASAVAAVDRRDVHQVQDDRARRIRSGRFAPPSVSTWRAVWPMRRRTLKARVERERMSEFVL